MDDTKRTGCRIVAYRPPTHPKGENILMDIPYCDPIPSGVILGKTHSYLSGITGEDIGLKNRVEQTT